MVNQFFIIFAVFALSCIRTLKKQESLYDKSSISGFLCSVYYMRSVGELFIMH